MSTRRFGWLLVLLSMAVVAAGATSYRALATSSAGNANLPEPAPQRPRYAVLGWNNLGMACYDPDFSSIAVLPPYNTLVAQVIKIGDPPQIVTSGVIVEYSFPDNTYSVDRRGRPDKTNFWQYDVQPTGKIETNIARVP